jgi:hypothetical protein
VTLSFKDKIALLVASGLGAAFGYLAILAGFAGVTVGAFYGIVVIPLVVVFFAEQRRLLVWQVCVISFASAIVMVNVHFRVMRWGEGPAVFLLFWAIGSVLSSPAPGYFYLQRAKKRKSYRMELFFVGLLFLIVLCSLWTDPFLIMGVATIWIVVWLLKCLWDWRSGLHPADSKKAAFVAASALILACVVPILAVGLSKQKVFALAMRNDHLKIAAWLVRNGADPNASDKYGQTALREAAWNGNEQAVTMLLSLGAKVDLEAKAEFQGLMPSGTALAVASSVGRTEICTSLLAAGADANKKNQYGTTPLLAALGHGSLSCVPDLLDHGADVNVRNSLGETPLMLLVQFDPDRTPIARHILDQMLADGSDVLAKDDKGQTAEDWARLYHRDGVEKRLHEMRNSTYEQP